MYSIPAMMAAALKPSLFDNLQVGLLRFVERLQSQSQ
jgi:hypothetical protein